MHAGDLPAAALDGNAARVYEATAETHPDRTALSMHDRSLTHAELDDRAVRLAGGLREAGLEPGDRVAIYLPNCPEFVVAALGAFWAGTPFVPLNPQLTPREVAYHLRDSDAAAAFVGSDLRGEALAALDRVDGDPLVVGVPAAEATAGADDGGRVLDWADRRFGALDGAPHREPREDDDVAMQPYSSGTTGRPKGALLTHRNLRAQSLMGFERTNLPTERERFLSVLPLAHIAGFVNRTWQPLVRGATVHLRDPRAWDPEETMATIERERITKFGAVTTMYVDVVNHESFGEYDLSSLAEAMQGGDGMPAAVQDRFEEVTGVELFEAYGLTETGGGTHAGINSTFGPRQGTVGQPLRASDCKVVDDEGDEVPPGEVGELLVRGPHVMPGYHERPEETAAAFTEEGYLRTGDVVSHDEDNYYRVVDRKSHVIVTGGYNVYPREVEEVLHEHPAVVDAAVVGVPDERKGERPKAYVVPDDGDGERPDGTAVREFARERLADYKHPREVTFVERLPRTTSGKVKKFELRAESD